MQISIRNIMESDMTQTTNEKEEPNIFIFVDFDNVPWKNLNGIEKLSSSAKVSFYVNPSNKGRLTCEQFQGLRKSIKGKVTEKVATNGKQSVDFNIVYDMAHITSNFEENDKNFIYIMSGDKDLDSIILLCQRDYADNLKACERFETIEEILDDIKIMSISNMGELRRLCENRLGAYRYEQFLHEIRRQCISESSL